MKIVLKTRQVVYVALIGMTLVFSGVILGYRIFPKIVEKRVWEAAILQNNTEQFELFKEIPFPFDFKVYFFNVENPDQILQGAKPIVKEVGPFHYKVYHARHFVEIEKDEISYYDYMLFKFDKEASGEYSDEVKITSLNTPLNALIQTVEYMSPGALATVDSVLDEVFKEDSKIFVTKSLKEFLFDGSKFCTDEQNLSFGGKMICKQFKSKASPKSTMKVVKDGVLYSYMSYKNGSHIHHFTVNSGINSSENVSNLIRYNNKTRLNVWGDESTKCNKIRGTTNFRPYITPNMTFEVFAEDICRTMKMAYYGTETVKGIEGFRFEVPPDALNAPLEDSEDYCYCVNKSRDLNGDFGCLKDGVLDLSNCIGAPVILSFPHFLYGDQEYISSVTGVHPNKSLHDTFLVIEPTAGVPLKMARRIQFNMFLRPVEDITMLENVSTSLMPLLWIEETMVLGDEYIDKIKTSLIRTLKILEIIKWLLIGTGVIITAISAILIINSK